MATTSTTTPTTFNASSAAPNAASDPRAITLPATSWAALTAQVKNHLINLAHSHTGRALPQSVRLDVPPAMAQAPATEYAELLAWLRANGLQVLVFGSRRADVRLEVH